MQVAAMRPGSDRPRAPQPGSAGVRLATVHQPGTYICDWSGHLLRISDRDARERRFVELVSAVSGPLTVTRISANPRLSRLEARALAGRLGLTANF